MFYLAGCEEVGRALWRERLQRGLPVLPWERGTGKSQPRRKHDLLHPSVVSESALNCRIKSIAYFSKKYSTNVFFSTGTSSKIMENWVHLYYFPNKLRTVLTSLSLFSLVHCCEYECTYLMQWSFILMMLYINMYFVKILHKENIVAFILQHRYSN